MSEYLDALPGVQMSHRFRDSPVHSVTRLRYTPRTSTSTFTSGFGVTGALIQPVLLIKRFRRGNLSDKSQQVQRYQATHDIRPAHTQGGAVVRSIKMVAAIGKQTHSVDHLESRSTCSLRCSASPTLSPITHHPCSDSAPRRRLPLGANSAHA